MAAPHFDRSDSPVHRRASHATATFEPISHDIAGSVGREMEKSDPIFTSDPMGENRGVLNTVGHAFSALQAKQQPVLSVGG